MHKINPTFPGGNELSPSGVCSEEDETVTLYQQQWEGMKSVFGSCELRDMSTKLDQMAVLICTRVTRECQAQENLPGEA